MAADQNGSAFGWFTGNIVYRQKEQGSLEGVVELAGQIQDVDLAAVSGRVSKAALAGTVSGTLERAVLEAGELRAVTARLRIERLDLRGLLGLAGWPAAAGMAWLDLHELRCEGGRVQALLAEARVEGLEVGPLLAPLHIGTVTGQLDANVRKLKIVDNQVAELAGEARVRGPGGTGGTVDRSVLEAAAQRLLNITLPPVLPEKIPYSDLGARLHVEENELYVQGVAGPDEAFLLVADVAGMPMPLVPQPPVPIRLDDLREGLERQIGRFAHAATAWVQGRVSPMD